MAEYIERENVVSKIKEIKNDFSPTVRPVFDVASYIISNAPTADVVEVVRCKDCKHKNEKEICEKFRQRYPFYPEDNFYCGFGERGEDK